MPSYCFVVQKNGILPEGAKRVLANIVRSLAGEHVVFTVDKKKDKRSLDQNAYIRGVINPHIREVHRKTGNSVTLDQVHEELLDKFAPTVTHTSLDGKVVTRPLRTHEMSKDQCKDYITEIEAWIANFGFPVEPNQHT